MSNHRSGHLEGGSYFFTLATARRRPLLSDPGMRFHLRLAMQKVRSAHPFEIIAMVLLPDHVHAIWRLPDGDADYAMRWRLIKGHVSRYSGCTGAVWQPRFREHTVRDPREQERLLDYIHWNPVKHGLVAQAADWPWSSYHRFVARGAYPGDWCGESGADADDLFG